MSRKPVLLQNQDIVDFLQMIRAFRGSNRYSYYYMKENERDQMVQWILNLGIKRFKGFVSSKGWNRYPTYSRRMDNHDIYMAGRAIIWLVEELKLYRKYCDVISKYGEGIFLQQYLCRVKGPGVTLAVKRGLHSIDPRVRGIAAVMAPISMLKKHCKGTKDFALKYVIRKRLGIIESAQFFGASKEELISNVTYDIVDTKILTDHEKIDAIRNNPDYNSRPYIVKDVISILKKDNLYYAMDLPGASEHIAKRIDSEYG